MSSTSVISEPAAQVVGGVLYLEHFEEHDPDVVDLVGGAEDAAAAVHACLAAGARGLALAKTSIEAASIEDSFEAMSARFDGTLEETSKQITESTEAILDGENGALPKVLAASRGEVEELLGSTFDPESKRSVIATMEKVLERAAEEQIKAVRRIVDPDAEDSPLGRHRAEIISQVKETRELLHKAIAEVSEKIAVKEARAEIAEKSAGKGFSYEDLIHEAVSPVAAGYGDMAEKVGTATGAAGNKAGDELVTLELEQTRGVPARYVLEQKDRRLGMDATIAEVERAMENREAQAGIAVFSSAGNSPGAMPFQYRGRVAIVVFDKATLDDSALRLACMWARWVARRQLAGDAEAIDADRIEALIEEARRAIARVSTVRRCHTSARNKIDEASSQVDDLAAEVNGVLDTLATELRA